MSKISVVIPIYNVEKYLKDCLESVVNQTYKDLEIVLVNDCTKDNSIAIVNEYLKKDSRIRHINHKKNKGLGPARNTGLKASSGEFVFFLDSDDYLEKDAIEKLYNSIQKSDADFATTTTLAFADDESDETVKRTNEMNNWLNKFKSHNYQVDWDNFLNTVTVHNCVSWGKLFRKSFLIDNKLEFIDGNFFHEDEGFWIKVCANFPLISYVEDTGLYYRIRKSAITGQIDKKKNKKKKYLHFKKVLYDAVKYIDKNIEDEFKKPLKTLLFNSSFSKFFEFKLGFLFGFRWHLNDKAVSLFNISIFREKKKDSKYKKAKLFGIKLYKMRLEENSFLLNYKIKKFIKIGAKNSLITTKNNDERIFNAIKELNEFYFLPNKGNLGDVVIASSEFQYFDSNSFNYSVYDILQKDKYNKPFNFVYGDGGIWHRFYQNDYQEVIEIFKSPNLKNCVVLPSSFYDCEDVINCFDERFTVFAREKQSLDYCKSLNNKANFILADDMVINADFNMYNRAFYNKDALEKFIKNNTDEDFKKYIDLYKRYYFANLRIKRKLALIDDFEVGYLLRGDKEKVINIVKKSIDISSYLGGFGCDKAYSYLCTKVFLDTINKFDIIVTDRLHAAICAAKLDKQVLMLDNSYKKLSEVYNNSMIDFKNVKLTSTRTLDDDIIKAKENIKKENQKKNFEVNSFEEFMSQYGSFENEYGIERRFW